jgi:hypothetical protein
MGSPMGSPKVSGRVRRRYADCGAAFRVFIVDAMMQVVRPRQYRKALDKRRSMALTVDCPQCGSKIGQRCPGVGSAYHAARSDLAFQQRHTRGLM